MFNIKNHAKKIKVISPTNLYKWNANYLKLQQSFFEEQFIWIREKQIRDFVRLNGYRRVYLMRDQNVLNNLADEMVNRADLADLVIVIDQRFSRVACPVLITQIQELLQQCPTLYLCLNRHYIDIDNSFTDITLDADWQRAITQWLSRELAPSRVIDLSFYWDDRGDYLSWSIPDRHYLITA